MSSDQFSDFSREGRIAEGLPIVYKVPTLKQLDIEASPFPGEVFVRVEQSPAMYGRFLVPEVARRTTGFNTILAVHPLDEDFFDLHAGDIVLVADYHGVALPPLRGWDPEYTYMRVKIEDLEAKVLL